MMSFYGAALLPVGILLVLGIFLLWWGKKQRNKALELDQENQERYTGQTTLRVIKVEKDEKDVFDSSRPEGENWVHEVTYTPVYEYTVNGQRYEYHTSLGSSDDRYQIGAECPGYYDPKNPELVTETLRDPFGGGKRFFGILLTVLGILCIIFACVRLWGGVLVFL